MYEINLAKWLFHRSTMKTKFTIQGHRQLFCLGGGGGGGGAKECSESFFCLATPTFV